MKHEVIQQIKMAVQANVVLTSLYNRIKITTKLQNNHHLALPEIELNRNPTTEDIKKPHEDWQEG